MINNKRGKVEVSGILVLVLAIVGLLASFSYAGEVYFDGSFAGSIPGFIGGVVDGAISIITPIFDLVYFVIAPPLGGDVNENTQAIAIAIFLLLVMVGHKSLAKFEMTNTFSITLSVIVGIIASRSLTETILKEAAFGASPLAAASLILAFIPVLIISKYLEDPSIFSYSSLTKSLAYVVVSLVYLFFYAVIFDSTRLGLIYAIGILLLALSTYLAPILQEKKAEKLGEFIGGTAATLNKAEKVAKGAGSKGRKAVGEQLEFEGPGF